MKKYLIIFVAFITLSIYATESKITFNQKKRKNAASTDQSESNEKKLMLKKNRKTLILPLHNKIKDLLKMDSNDIEWLKQEINRSAVLCKKHFPLGTVTLTIDRGNNIKEILSMTKNSHDKYTGAHKFQQFNNNGGLIYTVHKELDLRVAEHLKKRIKNSLK